MCGYPDKTECGNFLILPCISNSAFFMYIQSVTDGKSETTASLCHHQAAL